MAEDLTRIVLRLEAALTQVEAMLAEVSAERDELKAELARVVSAEQGD